jgi:hypothetical protein
MIMIDGGHSFSVAKPLTERSYRLSVCQGGPLPSVLFEHHRQGSPALTKMAAEARID